MISTSPVRKHRAPNGALRLTDTNLHVVVVEAVRKHRAPNGALRHLKPGPIGSLVVRGQKALSTIRCIKT